MLVDDQPVRACMVPIASLAGRRVTTIEGLGTPGKPDPLQAAFIAEQAAQCGYCTSGMIMSARALLRETPRPTEDAGQGGARWKPLSLRRAHAHPARGDACFARR